MLNQSINPAEYSIRYSSALLYRVIEINKWDIIALLDTVDRLMKLQ